MKTNTKFFLSLILCLIICLAACDNKTRPIVEVSPTPRDAEIATQIPTPIPTLEPNANPVLISEVLAGVQGNNNYEFIELYNRSQAAVDLRGWTFWYRLPTGQEDLLVYRFSSTTMIPPQGHLLLGRLDQDLGLPLDGEFEQSLNTAGGGLQLRRTDETIQDVIGWGNAPTGYFEGQALPALPNGFSIERLPSGLAGNATDNNDNALDFILNPTPNPQNTGSPLTPPPNACIDFTLTAPPNAEPGSDYPYVLSITNQAGEVLTDILATFPIPRDLTFSDANFSEDLVEQIEVDNNTVTWSITNLEAGETQTMTVMVSVPWTYFTALVTNYFAQSPDCSLPEYGEPVRTSIEGGIVPIATARTLQGYDLTIEGIATFYTGGLYAGGGNTKFYVEDETGGIQIQVFGGAGSVGIGIGSHVQVRGTVGIYRGATQIVPIVVPDDVIRFDESVIPQSPSIVSIREAITNRTDIPGRLIQVEGTVTRVEEFSYSFEIDLVDETGEFVTLYVDKQTNINVEMIEVGQQYRTTGILEILDTSPRLYPRIQEDLEQVFPPELLLEVDAPIFMAGGNLITYTITAFNYTLVPLTNVIIQATVPFNTTVSQIENGGSQVGNVISWQILALSGNGSSTEVRFVVMKSASTAEIISLGQTSVVATEWPNAVAGTVLRTFVGSSVPIWAIQGDGFRSPYVLDRLTTEGVVTGVFPGLSGFFIQEAITDNDPRTSEGLFISSGAIELTLLPGDNIQISGVVRELSNQTALQVNDPADIVLISQANPLPLPVELDPPITSTEAGNYYEALEGMLVQVTGPAMAISPTSKYGEYVIVLTEHGVNRLYQGEDNGIAIMVDDGSNAVHTNNSTLPYTVTSGDTINNLIGPLAFTYSRYKIEPIAVPQIGYTGMQPGTTQPLAANEFSIMTWNARDMFDILDPNPVDPPRPSLQEYRTSLTAAAGTIAAANFPTIVALQEIENIGILDDLAANEILVGYEYQPVLIEGTDSRGIDVGYLVRGDQATIISVEQRSAPDDLFSRPPLVLHVEIRTPNAITQLFLINNHFLSMSGGVEATEPRRIAQTAWNLALAQEIVSEFPGALIAIVGDLNSYYTSAPINAFRSSGMFPVMDNLPPEERYSYIFEGESQVLDYIIVTPELMSLLLRVEVLRMNADFPPQASDDITPLGESDHDPVIAVFAP
jgi:uncharacterized repeat protein (TIGR01451 family)